MKTYVAHLYGGVNNAYMHDTVVLEAESYEAAKKKVAIHWGLNPMTGITLVGMLASLNPRESKPLSGKTNNMKHHYEQVIANLESRITKAEATLKVAQNNRRQAVDAITESAATIDRLRSLSNSLIDSIPGTYTADATHSRRYPMPWTHA